MSTTPAHSITFREALVVWLKVAALSFGGPTGQIAVMHRLLVDEKKWISDNRFLHALNYCMLLPGPEAQQLATYIGWLLHGKLGGLTAGLLFVLPGFVSILTLSILYAEFQDISFVQALFFGLKPAVIAVVIEAVLRIGKKALKNGVMVALAAAAFTAIFFFHAPFPAIIVTAAVIGYLGGKWREDLFYVIKPHADKKSGEAAERYVITDEIANAPHTQPRFGKTLLTAVVWLAVWLLPVAGLAWKFGKESVYVREGVFFSEAALVTFGGAYSVLPFVAQQAVEKEKWLSSGEMLDGLGMAETTPGPLIQVVQFVGFLGAYRSPGELTPLQGGVLGSVVTTWVTFSPCFLWIFVGAPYIERLRGNKSLSTALSGVTAAVVGVVLNLAVWFALKTIFPEVTDSTAIHLRPMITATHAMDIAALVIAVAACVAMLRFKVNMIITLAASAAVGLGYFLLFRA